MTIEQIIEIPASRRITISVPRTVPEGKVILTFTPASVVKKRMTEAEEIELLNLHAERLNQETMDILSYQNWFSETEISDT